MDYAEYLNSDHWQNLRRRILRRDKYHCRACGTSEIAELHVHHITYENIGHEHDGDLITLCSGCHEKVHGRTTPMRKVMLMMYAELLEKKRLGPKYDSGMYIDCDDGERLMIRPVAGAE